MIAVNVLKETCKFDGSQIKRPIVVFLTVVFSFSMKIGGEGMSHFLRYHHVPVI